MRRYLLLILLLAYTGAVQAQYVEEPGAQPAQAAAAPITQPNNQGPSEPWYERLGVGGNFSAQFGNITYIDVSPLVVYKVNERLQVGPGVTYIYYSSNYAGYKFSTSQYGGRLFGRYIFLENFFAHAELEAINFEVQNKDRSGRFWAYNPLAGGGYRAPLGDNGGGIFITALYNFNYIPNRSPYTSPFIFRIGFTL